MKFNYEICIVQNCSVFMFMWFWMVYIGWTWNQKYRFILPLNSSVCTRIFGERKNGHWRKDIQEKITSHASDANPL